MEWVTSRHIETYDKMLMHDPDSDDEFSFDMSYSMGSGMRTGVLRITDGDIKDFVITNL